MRPAPFASTRRTTRSNANIVWSAIFLLALLTLWFAWSLPSLVADEAAQPVNAQSLPQTLVPLDGIVQLAAGQSHTCALTAAGGVKCWGSNWNGQLGDSTTVNRNLPVEVVGLSSGVVAITAGISHTCALSTTDGVKCWGSNYSGQLGDDTKENKSSPVDVVGLSSGVAAIAAGGSHTCALITGGGVKCWGANDSGQLGDGTTVGKTTAVNVMGLGSSVVAITTGESHSCALISGDGGKCWGANSFGQLGDGTTANKNTPEDVIGLGNDMIDITAGWDHTCGLTASGGIKCWGWNYFGQLGDGSTGNKSTPVNVVGLDSGVAAVAVGRMHTCALDTAGGVKCWGWNYFSQLGDGGTRDSRIPVNTVGLGSGTKRITVGEHHTCAVVTDSGVVKCWGYNQYGQLGVGTTGDKSTPVDVVGLNNGIIAISAGGWHSCALTAVGGVKCWGRNAYGQLGDDTLIDKITPVDTIGLGSVATGMTASGQYFTCALTNIGGVKCWGWNEHGQLGDGTTADKIAPIDVEGLNSGITAVTANGVHTCALGTSGGVKCWGGNDFGQLGDGTMTGKSVPVDVVGLDSSVAAITAGYFHTCALITTGAVKCWGHNGFGQLGDGTTVGNTIPVDVVGLGTTVAAITTGHSHTCVLTTAGGVKCWGRNDTGQLGDGSTMNKTTPTDVVGLGSGIAAIAAGWAQTCALTTTGEVKCWGANAFGQLGIGPTWPKTTPVDVTELSDNIVAISSGFKNSCGLTAQNTIKCWGSNEDGQLGDGTAWSSTPVDVLVLDTTTPTPTPTITPTPTATVTPTPTSPSPIVFVHGWNGLSGSCDQVEPDSYFSSVDDDLRTAGYDVSYVYLETSSCHTPSLTENVKPLKAAVGQAKEKSGGQNVILIAHSMGGLVSRAYVEGSEYQGDVSALFTFGSPHMGVPTDPLVFFANGLTLGKYCEKQTAVCDFSILGMNLFNQTYASRRAGVQYHVISGDAPFFSRNARGKMMDAFFFEANDGIVPFSSGVGLPGAVDRAKSDEVHSEIFGDHSYFIRDGGPSVSYLGCLKPMLVDKSTNNCGSAVRTADSSLLTPLLPAHLPFESGVLLPGETVTRSIQLGNGAALFAAQWQTGTVAVRLLSPNGQIIDPAFASSHPSEASYDADGLSATYYLTSTLAGAWRLVLQAGSIPAQGSAYTTFVAFDSEITLAGGTDRTWYTPGATASITASLSGSPASAVITATILRTDSVTDTVTLQPAGPGAFEGAYTVPNAPGYTEVRFIATGATATNVPFERGVGQAIQIASSTAAALSGSYADRGEDSAGDGLYEALAVDVGVTANVSGTFAVAAELVSAVNGTLIARAAASAAIITGTHTLTLRFDGDTIRAAQQDGPYRVTSVVLIDRRAAALPVQEAADVWTTATYGWQEFGAPLQLYLPSVTR